ncbi:MAG: hypothetical protein U9Q15_05460 [Patescibacteria group bacterium]|nr:hypothetical protein [Patescibacteria group bacterium]
MLGILSTLLLLGQEIENSFHIPSYEQRTPSVVFSSSLYPISQEESHIFDDFTSEGLVLFDMETNEVLYSKSAYLSLPIASLTKLVTAGVILENYEDLSQIVTTPELPSDHVFGMSVGMQRGLQFTLYQLLKAALIQSGNDAAYTLAIAHSENLDIFIEEMNSFVRSLGIRSQLFNNSTGLPVSGV